MTNMVEAVVIEPDDNVRKVTVDAHDIVALKRLIGGGYLELVPLKPGVCHGYADEDGKQKQLPTNHLATMVVAILRGAPGALYDPLRGPVAILGDGKDGEEASVPQDVGHALLEAYAVIVEAQS